MPESRQSKAVIAIVDDDLTVREGLSSLIRSAGWRAGTSASAEEFLARRGATFDFTLPLQAEAPG
jgi:FixJ family two-component response regulator